MFTFAKENTFSNLSGPAVPREYVLFESDPVRPLAMSHDGKYLFVTNIPDSHIEMYAITKFGLSHYQSIPVGLEPVAVAVTQDDSQLWVVNHLSDSISVIDLTVYPAIVQKTLLVGDQPRDIVFGGENFNKAFITTAHRGQNYPDDRLMFNFNTGRADVWIFDVHQSINDISDQAKKVIALYGDTPRALAVSKNGKEVYAAIFKSGNKTTTLAPAAIQSYPKPPPLISADGVQQPVSGVIVKNRNGHWVDEINRSYNQVVALNLPDYDVFVIDADLEFPIEKNNYASVGTTLFNMSVHPQSGDIFVSNIDSRNHVRFEGIPAPGRTSVRGNLADNQISIISNNQVNKIKLNKHLDFNNIDGTEEDRNKSLSMPMQMQFSDDGSEIYVTAFGSQKIARYDTQELIDNSFTPDSNSHVELTAGGPAGLVLDSNNNNLYVYTRFDNGLSTINLNDFNETNHILMHNPEPKSTQEGRPFFYDARKTSGFGNDSCATCHIFGDNDELAWDLGNPDGTVQSTPNSYHPIAIGSPFLSRTSHPMKGPMTTQSMRGLVRHGPQHWRGDRKGENRVNGETLEEAAFKEFNGAFDVLLAKPEMLTNDEMQKFTDFAMQLTYPPNPNRAIDNTLTAEQAAGKFMFDFGVLRSNGSNEVCTQCHPVDFANGIYGTTGQLSDNTQPGERDFKIPHFRNQYTKIGMFSTFPGSTINQIRGFAFNHNGATSNTHLFSEFGVTQEKVRQLKSYLYAFPTESPPILGQQLSINNQSYSRNISRLNVFINQASINFPIPECDLTFSTVIDNQTINGLFDRNSQLFTYDDNQTGHTVVQLKQNISESDQPYTFTCQPWGSGERIALDRDQDGLLNSEERINGSDALNADSSAFKPYKGLWYNPATSGRGFDIETSGNNLTAIWYTHREDGTPIWYIAVAPISKNWQAEMLEVHWDPDNNQAISEVAGNLSINFSNSSEAEINWSLGSNSGSEPIQPLNFRTQPANIDLTGLWYDPNESGWGLSLDTQGDTRVAIVYYYDENNLPTWSISQSNNDLNSLQTPLNVTGSCPWCEYVLPTNKENGEIELELSSFESLNLNILQHDPDTQVIQWQRGNAQFVRLTDTPY